MKLLSLIIVFCLISLIVFAQQNDKSKAIKAGIIVKGMTKEEVIASTGEPYFKRETYWWYPIRKFIFFKDGKVRGATFPLGIPKQEL